MGNWVDDAGDSFRPSDGGNTVAAPSSNWVDKAGDSFTPAANVTPNPLLLKGYASFNYDIPHFMDWTQKVQQAYNGAQLSFTESTLGHQVKAGDLTLEQANQKLDTYQQLKAQAKNAQDYEANSWRDGSWLLGMPASFGVEMAKQLPYLEHAAAAWGAGAAPVAAAGALTGPGEAVGLPSAAAVGLGTMAAWTMSYIQGQDYLRRRNLGATHEDATNWSFVNAVGQGALQTLMMSNLGSVPIKAAAPALEAAAPGFIKAIINSYPAKAAGFTVSQGLFNVASTYWKQLTDQLESTQTDKPNMMPTVADAAKERLDAWNQGAFNGFLFHALGTATGKGAGYAGRLLNEVNKYVDGEHAARQQVKIEQAQAGLPALQQAMASAAEEPKELTKTQIAKQARTERFNALMDTMQTHIDAFKSKYQIESDSTILQDVTKFQGMITDFIQQSGLPKKDQARFMDAIKEVHGDQTFARVAEQLAWRMSEASRQLDKEAALNRLDKVVGRIEKTEEGTTPKLGLSEDTQSVLSRAVQFIKDPAERGVTVAKYEAAEKTGQIPGELQKDMDIAALVGDKENLSTQEVHKLADSLETVLAGGKATRLEEVASAANARKNLLNESIEGVQSNKSVTVSANAPEPPFEIAKLPEYARNVIVANWGTWPSLVRNIFRDAENVDKFRRLFWTGDVLNNISENHRSNIRTLFGNIEQATGITDHMEINELLRKGAKTKITVDVDGEQVTRPINQWLDKLAQWQDEDARQALISGNKYTPENPFKQSTGEAIEAELNKVDPRYNKIWPAYAKTYKDIFYRLDNEYFVKTGQHLPNNPDYSGPMLHKSYEAILAKDQELDAQGYGDMLNQNAKVGRSTVLSAPGSTKARSGDASALAYQDIHTKYKNYSNLTENWIGWRKPLADTFNPVFGNVQFKDLIKNKFGADMLDSISLSLKDTVFGRVDNLTKLDRFLNKYVLANIPFSVLATKPPMLAKHIGSSLNGARYIPVADYIKNMVEFYKDPETAMKEIGPSVEYQGRHASREMQTLSALQAPDKMEAPWSVAMQHWMMAPTVYGIRIGDAAEYYAISKYWRNQGLSPKEAMIKADMAVNESQVSGRVDMRATFARGGPLERILFAFQSQVNSQALDVLQTWDRFTGKPTKANFVEGLKASTGAAFTVALFESVNAAWRYGTASNDKQRNNAALDFFLAPAQAMTGILNLPILKGLARSGVAGTADLVAISQGEEKPFSIYDESNLTGVFKEIGENLYNDASQLIQDPNWIADHFFKSLYDVNRALSPFVKTPAGPPLRSAAKFQESLTGEN